MGKLRRLAALAIASAAISATSVAVGTGTASAIDGCPSYPDHCYGIGGFGYPNGGNNGAPVYLNSVWTQLRAFCLQVGDPNTDFVNYEMWLRTNANNPDLNTWVEAGLTDGTLWASPGQEEGLINFWADARPDGSYNEHYISPAALGAYNTAAFYWVPNTGNWDVSYNSTTVGTSTDNGAWGGGSDNGLESTTPNMAIDGDSYGWSYQDPSNVWHDVSNTLFWEDPGYTSGYVSGSSVHAQSNSCTLPSATTSATTASAPAPSTTEGNISATVKRFAMVLGESAPGPSQYVKTTRKQASSAASGAVVDSDQAVYLVQAPGKFTVPSARAPRGAKAPTGSNLTVTIDATTGQVLDWGVRQNQANLSHFGAASTIR